MPLSLPWQSRLDQDVLMVHRWGCSWRLLNRYHVLTRASGRLYGTVYWLGVLARRPYRYGMEE